MRVDPSRPSWWLLPQTMRRRGQRVVRWMMPLAVVLIPLIGPLGQAATVNGTPGTWTPTGAMATTRYGHAAALLPNGNVLVAGGYSDALGSGYLVSAEVYDPTTGTWSPSGSMSAARYFPTATLLLNGDVLVAGGFYTNTVQASAEIYDPNTGTWTPTDSMSIGRANFTATLLSSGIVLVAGGIASLGGNPVASAELYNPSTGTWAATGSMTTDRAWHTATLLPNGQVLVAGGLGQNSAELYNPSTGTWTATGSMTYPRWIHTATLLPDGQVLVAGGTNAGNSAELYSPDSGTWTSTGGMNTARVGQTATLLTNGQVLVAGGVGGNYLASAELYDPSTGTWTSTGSMNNARTDDTATLLPSGQVLVAGGHNTVGLADAELYQAAFSSPTPTSTSTPIDTPTATPSSTPTPTPRLSVNPTSGAYSHPLTLSGLNFGSDETVNIFANSVTHSPVYSATTDNTGAFTLTSTVQQGPAGMYTLIALGQSSALSATAPFTIVPSTTLSVSSGHQAALSGLSGYGFAAHEAITATWQSARGLVLGYAKTNALGTFAGASAITFTVPYSPSATYKVYATGASSGLMVSSPFTITPLFSIAPVKGAPGSAATVGLSGFGVRERVALLWDCASRACHGVPVLGTPTTTANGDVTTFGVTIPNTATVGTHTIGALGQRSHIFATTSFRVVP